MPTTEPSDEAIRDVARERARHAATAPPRGPETAKSRRPGGRREPKHHAEASVDEVIAAAADDLPDMRRKNLESYLTRPTTARAIAAGWSPRTRDEYVRAWRQFREWCRPATGGAPPGRWFQPMPCAPDVLAEYLQHLADRGLAPSTINKHKAAIMAWHRLHGQPVPDGVPALGVQREHERTLARQGWVKKRAPALRIEDVVRCLAVCDRTTPQGMRDAAMILLGFSGLLRVSEARSLNIAWAGEEAEGLALLLPGTKTSRHAEHPLIPHWQSDAGDHHPALCPVEATLAWAAYLIGRGAPRTSPLLRGVDQHNRVAGLDADWLGGRGRADTTGRMSTRRLNSAFQAVVARAKIPHAHRYTFHSLRIGGASELRRRGATIEEVADAGRWSRHSTVVMDYLRAAEKWIDHPMSKVGAYAVTEHLSAVLAAWDNGS